MDHINDTHSIVPEFSKSKKEGKNTTIIYIYKIRNRKKNSSLLIHGNNKNGIFGLATQVPTLLRCAPNFYYLD
jgi:hypothetical protein